jgi:hypothetical protein
MVEQVEAHKVFPLFQMLQLKAALKLEIGSKMKLSRGSPMAFINKYCGTKFRTKKACLEYMEQQIEKVTVFDNGHV